MMVETTLTTKRQIGGSYRKLLAYLLLSAVGVSIIVALFRISDLSLSHLWKIVATLPVWAYVVLAALQVTILLLASVKWRIVLARLPVGGRVLPLRDALAGTTLGALFGQILPIQLITPIARAWVARPHKISTERAVGTSVFEQVFEIVVLLTMWFVSALIVLAGIGPFMACFLALAVGFIVVSLISPVFTIFRRLSALLANHLPDKAAQAAVQLEKALQQVSEFPQQILFRLTALSFLRYLCLVTLNVWIISILIPGIDILVLALAFPAVLFVMSLPFIPNGLGIVEVTWTGVLISQGVEPVQAIEVALSLRVISTIAFLAVAPLLLMFRTSAAVPA